MAGLAVFLLASITAVILYLQFPPHFAGLAPPEVVRERVKQMSTQETRVYFHQLIEPGIELREGTVVERNRSMAYLGMDGAVGVGVIGLILMGVGLALRVRTPAHGSPPRGRSPVS